MSKNGKRLGRPPGAVGRRARDLKGFVDATYGGSVALQLARLALVTPAEVKAAGSMAGAVVAKAADLVERVRSAQAKRDEWLRQVVREELEQVAATVDNPEALRTAVKGFLGRVREASSGFGMKEALGMLAEARAQLLPYTDQKQPLAIDHTLAQDKPSVILMGAPPMVDLGSATIENTELFEGVTEQVSQPKSHDDTQGVEQAQLFDASAADRKSEADADPPQGG